MDSYDSFRTNSPDKGNYERLNESTTLENDYEVNKLRKDINERLKEKAEDPYDWLDRTGLSTIDR
jgi:hypothetical protein